ncbi:hypothetical protein Pla110_42330 [Polystyrenella longa]|uniref:DUF1214 domain-containing protein n=1 Tax=Polystyrenella longa TaxID=2528007 RepID=A0A518CTD8_9PLAN|nr:DUF1214 domain-containing protein [Polystyrenella longa]QDU82475.1 hypothetical protein Pla110_42330 [Polystyrenella longa]
MNMKLSIIPLVLTGTFSVAIAAAQSLLASESETPIVVNVDNFNKAQTDFEFAGIIKQSGINKVHSNRTPTPIDKQNVIRMNRDTLYSLGVINISKGATVTMPNCGKRYMSLMVINNDGYVNDVYYGAGSYELTMEKFDTPYVGVVIRTLADPEDPADLEIAHKLQDQIHITTESDEPFVLPNYDKASYEATLDAILDLAKGLKRYTQTFGSKADVDPVHFMIGTASAWGGLPDKDAQYVNVQPNLPVGEYEITVKDVPVKGFWSISLYNAKGYFQENRYNAYSLNSLTAKPNSDGSYTIRFGGNPDTTENCLPIMEGWNYAVRMYEPSQAIIDGTWTFPGPPQKRSE